MSTLIKDGIGRIRSNKFFASIVTWSHWTRVSRVSLIIAGLLTVLGLFVFLAHYYVRFGVTASYAGYQTLAAREVISGRLPYRDFAYPEMPLAPYLTGAIMWFSGFSLTAHRIVNAVFAGLGLLSIILAVRDRTGSWAPGISGAFVAVASPHWIAFQTQTTSHAPAGMFLAFAFSAAVARRPRRYLHFIYAVSTSLAVGCELATIIPALLCGLIVFQKSQTNRIRIELLASILASSAIILLPFIITATSNFIYFNWHHYGMLNNSPGGIFMIINWWRVSPGAVLVLFAGLFGIPSLLKAGRSQEILILLTGLGGIVAPLFLNSNENHFVAPAIPLATTAGVIALWSTLAKKHNPFRFSVWLFPAIALLYPLPMEIPAELGGATVHIDEAAAVIEDRAEPGEILTPEPIIAVTTGHRVLKGTELGIFSAMSAKKKKEAGRLKLTTLPELVAAVDRHIPVAIVRVRKESNSNFQLEIPSLEQQKAGNRMALRKAIRKKYKRVLKSTYYEVYIPRD
jgi:hypothetical protein